MNYCKRCVMPSTKPDLYLDEEGICNVCRNYEKRKEIDWEVRREELKIILGKDQLKDGGNWDCIIPFSDGKDSTYQVVHMLQLGKIFRTFPKLVARSF